MLVQEVRESRINCALLSLCFRLYPGVVMSNSPIFRVQVMRFSVPRRASCARKKDTHFDTFISTHIVYSLGMVDIFRFFKVHVTKN